MRTHPLRDDDKNQGQHRRQIALPLHQQVGSAQENVTLVPLTTSLSIVTDRPSASISFEQINYRLRGRRAKTCRRKSGEQILFNVTGAFLSGMNAILGPSGCGKSSLLDILADRKDTHGLSGQILVGGKPRSKFFKHTMGYVVQEDIISGTLTVRENLMFSANVRLASSKSVAQRTSLVNRILSDLNLERCADSRVGTHFIRGISGGEKRRVCIGMELVLSPSILFLDEPTSGLDASTAQNVMSSLHRLSRQGCESQLSKLVERSLSVLQLFDTVLLLSSGHPVYLGPSTGIIPYFSSFGFRCEDHDNPADFALDILIECSQSRSTVLINAYSQSHESTVKSNVISDDTSLTNERSHRSRFNEFFYVAQRTLRNTVRDPAIGASQIVVAILLGLLTGLVFNQIQLTIVPGVGNRLGVIFFIVINQIYSTTTALEPLVQERALFIHENVSGYYRVSTYFLAKLLCDLLPMRLIPSVIYSSIAYFMIGLQASIDRFLVFLFTLFLSTVFGSATCFFVASSIPIFVVSLIIVIFIFVVMMVFSGFLIDLESIFPSLRWIRWFSAFRYATNLLTVNEFRQLNFCEMNQTRNCSYSGEEVLRTRQIPFETAWEVWSNIVALSVMTVLLFFFTYLQLVRMKKVK